VSCDDTLLIEAVLMIWNRQTYLFFRALGSSALILAFSISATPVVAQLNVAVGKPVIDGSGSWDGGAVGVGAPFNGGTFPASLVVDGNFSEPADGTVSYWLGREGTLNEYFTLDLGESFAIDRIDLFNTHNRQFNDRGTDEFVIFGADAVDAANQLIDPTPILAGNLSLVNSQDVITPNSFPFSAPVNARYLKFQSLTSQPTYANNVGLNEIQVFTSAANIPNKAFGKPVIDGSGSWDGGVAGVGAAFNAGSFPATNVTDGSVNDTGFWLGREGTTSEYFTLDLEESIDIQEILLRNTHNSGSDDRGTREFRIWASNNVDASNQLISPVEILSGQLSNSTGLSPLPEVVFTAANGLTNINARYLRFETISDTYFNGNVGLNEIEVFSEIQHEPTPPPRNNVALGKPVIDGSSSWDGAAGQPFDGGTFPATRVTDGSQADAATGRSSFWLANENCPGPGCATPGETETFFTLDLGDVYDIEEIELTNTHNRQFNDRGTEEFVIFGATEVDSNNDLVNPFVVAAGTLARTDGQAPILPESFTAANGLFGGEARYLKFQPLTYYSSATNGGAGLNDIAVFGTLVPEPTASVLVMLSLGGLLGLRRRR
jgi:hypothetical protein